MTYAKYVSFQEKLEDTLYDMNIEHGGNKVKQAWDRSKIKYVCNEFETVHQSSHPLSFKSINL